MLVALHDATGDQLAEVDAAEREVAVLVARQVLGLRSGQHLGEALGEDDGAVVLAAALAGDDEVDDPVDEGIEREPDLAVLGLGEVAGDVLDGEHEVGLAGDRDAVGQPAGLAAHGLDDEVARGRDRVGAQVLELLGHDVDRGEEAEGEVDAAVVVVDGLGQVDDLDPARLGGQPLLVLVEEVGGLEGVVAADRDQRVDVEVDEGVVDVAQRLGARGVGQVLGLLDPLAGVGACGADHDAARVAHAVDVALLEDPVVLVGQEPVGHRVVVLEVGVTVEEADDLAAVLEERDRSGRDHGVGGGGGAAREHDRDAPDVIALARGAGGMRWGTRHRWRSVLRAHCAATRAPSELYL